MRTTVAGTLIVALLSTGSMGSTGLMAPTPPIAPTGHVSPMVFAAPGAGDGPVGGGSGPVAFWGQHGHEIAARAAVTGLPAEMPGFFRSAADQLVYLNPEPDRWRDRNLREMDQAFQYDHYIDLENVPEAARGGRDRFEYLAALYEAGLGKPERDGGFLPFRIMELYQRLYTGFRRWRAATDAEERAWIEARIINDAGTLGHYVTDGSQPHHTTIHFNGWSDSAANPNGFNKDRRFHGRFESAFVEAHVAYEDLGPGMSSSPRTIDDVHGAVWQFLLASNGEVGRLYQIDKDVGFDPDQVAPETKAFAVERLVAGAEMLRALWWSAWVSSGA